jgi:hypothetical protein
MFTPRKTSGRLVLASTAALLTTALPAHAYVDPGTGSMLIQFAIASIAGALFFLRDLRYKIGAWFSRSFGRDRRDSAPSETKGD